jgi:hypothetical protein
MVKLKCVISAQKSNDSLIILFYNDRLNLSFFFTTIINLYYIDVLYLFEWMNIIYFFKSIKEIGFGTNKSCFFFALTNKSCCCSCSFAWNCLTHIHEQANIANTSSFFILSLFFLLVIKFLKHNKHFWRRRKKNGRLV